LNSFEDVKKMCVETIQSNPLAKEFIPRWGSFEQYFYMNKILHFHIQCVSNYFEKSKKGKNTRKKEKIDMCKSIHDTQVQDALTFIVETTYAYHLYEVKNINVLYDAKNNNDNFVVENVNIIDIRMLKRFLNIFSIKKSNIMKSHVEVSIKFSLFHLLLEKVLQRKQLKIVKMDNLVEDLENIWKL
jgi:hypothetical protein